MTYLDLTKSFQISKLPEVQTVTFKSDRAGLGPVRSGRVGQGRIRSGRHAPGTATLLVTRSGCVHFVAAMLERC